MMLRAMASLALLAGLSAAQAVAYGPEGHSLVGAVADRRLAGQPTASKVADLIDGLTLAEAALLPDTIKSWRPKDMQTPRLPAHPEIEKQLWAFLAANPHKNQPADDPVPSHHFFHYTDVPVTGSLKYEGGKTGRSRFDVVQMIPFCIQVLRGKVPEDNERKITRPLAVILLAHYVGDIHQPLHVGAAYFDDNGQLVDPDAGGGAADHGGNNLKLVLQQTSDHGHAQTLSILHTYWDHSTVLTAEQIVRDEIRPLRKGLSGPITVEDIAGRLAATEPPGWKLPANVDVDGWSLRWADEILPVARDAHARLAFSDIHFKKEGHLKIAYGIATEMPQKDGVRYADWSGAVVRRELHKAGWRLAALLERVVE